MLGPQARLPEIDQLTGQLTAATEELSNVRFALEEDKATASAAQVGCFVMQRTDCITLCIACRLAGEPMPGNHSLAQTSSFAPELSLRILRNDAQHGHEQYNMSQ